MYKYIVNPETNRRVNVHGLVGRKVLRNYFLQSGGHSGPCALNSKTGRCNKSVKADGNCKVNPTGRCAKRKSQSNKKTTSTQNKDQFEPQDKDTWVKMYEEAEFDKRFAWEAQSYLGYFPSEQKLNEMMESDFGKDIQEQFDIDQLKGNWLEATYNKDGEMIYANQKTGQLTTKSNLKPIDTYRFEVINPKKVKTIKLDF